MIFRVKGTPIDIQDVIVGKVTRDAQNTADQLIYIAEKQEEIRLNENYLAVLYCSPFAEIDRLPIASVFNIPSLSHLQEGDIVSVGIDGNIRTLYRVNSYYNTILATERCNSN